jgi:hypothetical protein
LGELAGTERPSNEKIKIRCPSCSKLYGVNVCEIKSSSPHFICQICGVKFTFTYPALNAENIQTRIIDRHPQEKTHFSANDERHLKSCPKCGSLNGINAHECYSCQVIFDKVRDLSFKNEGIKTLPSLVRIWQELLLDFDNHAKHEAFISECESVQALSFAHYRYEQYLEAQPQNEFVKKMRQEVLWRVAHNSEIGTGEASMLNKMTTQLENSAFVQKFNEINWGYIFYWSAPISSIILFVIGISNLGLRNFIGFAAALMFLWVGLSYLFQGGIGYDTKSK